MNKKSLIALGVPENCVPEAIACIREAADKKGSTKPRSAVAAIVAEPSLYFTDPYYGALAKAIAAHESEIPERAPAPYRQWGDDIDDTSRQQIENACRLPVSVVAALMPDAHVGYGLPIGGVLACDNAVIPYAVGVDIACRMRLTLTDFPVDRLERNDARECESLDKALEKGTRFGVGKAWKRPYYHPVMDDDWSVTAVTRQAHDTAWGQLGTSGSGNHFVEWGIVELPANELELEAGRYVALLSHSGSRGAGARTCRRYTEIAQKKLPARFRDDKQLKHLAWLLLDDEAGQEYWAAMNLMGRYAAANHEVIHRNVLKLAGARAIAVVENHHNFAWKQQYRGREVIVHRKGATPAGKGVLGVIPGTMADLAYIVRGKGQPESLESAAHGAGRRMSRRAAKNQFRWHMWRDYLRERKVRLLAGDIDEVPGAYKNIHEVMRAQSDLVEVVGTFQPRIVMMCGDGSRAED